MPTRGNVHDLVMGQQAKITYTPFQLRILSSINVGNVFYVDSNGGGADVRSSGNGTFDNPYLTMNFADSTCTANNGDVVYVKPGHVETVAAAAGLDTNTAGVTWIALGHGAARPQVNFTATASTMTMTGASVYMENFLFTGGIDAVVTPIVISGADNSLINCETRDVTGQATDWITTTAAADRLSIIGHVHRGDAAAGSDTWLSLVGGDGAWIQPRWVDGNFAVAAIENVTTAATNLTICGSISEPSYLRNRNAGDVIITLVATTTGNVGPNLHLRLLDNAANIDQSVVGAAVQYYHPIQIVNLDAESGFVNAAGNYMMPDTVASTDV